MNEDLQKFLSAPAKQYIDSDGRYANFSHLALGGNSEIFKDEWDLFFGVDVRDVTSLFTFQ